MADERRRILELLAAGRISAEEADRLLGALNPRPAAPEPPAGGEAAPGGFKYLRVVVEPGPGSPTGDKVNIRVPFKLIRAGLKWMSFIPPDVRDRVDRELKGRGISVDLAKITPAELEELVKELRDLTVEVEGKDKVRVYCE